MGPNDASHLVWAHYNSPHCSNHLPLVYIVDATYKYNKISINIK